MKKCNDCDMEMIDGKLFGEPRRMNMDNDIDDFFVDVYTGGKTKFLGFEVAETKRASLKVRVCPKCGKVEIYVDPNDIKF